MITPFEMKALAGRLNNAGSCDVSIELKEEAAAALLAAAQEMERLAQWHRAVDEACVVNFLEPSDNAKDTLNKLIAWEQTVALDPAVSKEARELRDTYKQRAESAEAVAVLTQPKTGETVEAEHNAMVESHNHEPS